MSATRVIFYAYSVVVKSRREEYSQATRQALIDGAVTRFAERGYAHTSLDDIAATARVTKGALYHHFGGKQALFEAALNDLSLRAMDKVVAAARTGGDSWAAAIRGLDTYLDECRDSTYGQVVIREGPVALGFTRWQECEQEHAYGFTEAAIRALIDEGFIEPLPVDNATRVSFGMINAAAQAIADAPEADRERVADGMKAVLHRFLEGLRPAVRGGVADTSGRAPS